MTPRQIAVLAVRVLALYCVIRSLDYLQTVVNAAFSVLYPSSTPFAPTFTNTPLTIILSFTPFTAHAAFGALLWMFADALAVYMISKDQTEGIAQTEPPQILTIGIILLGIWLVASAAPTIIGLGIGYVFRDQGAGGRTFGVPQTIAEFIAVLLQTCIGVWLMFGARGLVKVFRSTHPLLWLRDVGRDPEMMRDKDVLRESSNP